MAYNNLSGTVMQPNEFLPRARPDGSVIIPIISGNLSTSDGADVLNVPRVSNATDNAIITNVGGDANTLTCESNLTFDGSSLNVVGSVTASVAISASAFFGDGSGLTGVSAGGSSAQGPIGSLQLQTGSGGLSGSADLLFSSNVLQVNGGLRLRRIHTSASLTASVSDYYIGVNSAAAPISIHLPNAGILEDGQTYVVKDEGGASDTNNITIQASGSQEIDGQNTVILESPYASIQLYSNGTDKFFIF